MTGMDIERVDTDPRVVAFRTLVPSSAPDLFRLVANPHRHHEFDGSSTVTARVIGPRELQPGDRFRVSMRMGPLPYAITSTVVDLVPDRVVEWRHPGGHTWRWEFEPQPGGGTLVTESFDYRHSKAAPVLDLVKVAERNAVSIRRSLLNLQRLAA